jgi:ankyrin repeat protein
MSFRGGSMTQYLHGEINKDNIQSLIDAIESGHELGGILNDTSSGYPVPNTEEAKSRFIGYLKAAQEDMGDSDKKITITTDSIIIFTSLRISYDGLDLEINNNDITTPLDMYKELNNCSELPKSFLLNMTSHFQKFSPLCFAAKEGNKELVKKLIESHKDNQEALENLLSGRIDKKIFFEYANDNMLSNLAPAVIKNFIEKKDDFGSTLLLRAIQDNDLNKALKLIKLGADVNTTDSKGNTPLVNMLKFGQINTPEKVKVINALIGKNADFNVKIDKVPLVFKVIEKYNEYKIYLGKEDNSFDKILKEANLNVQYEELYKDTPIHAAIRENNGSLTAILENKGKDDRISLIKVIDKRNRQGDTPLTLAAKNGNKDAIEALIDKGADKSKVNKDGDTVLIKAIKSLVEEENNLKNPDADEKQVKRKIQGLKNCIQTLIKNNAALNIADKDGKTAIHHIININGQADKRNFIQNLKSKGVSINAVDNNGRTALFEATSNKDEKQIQEDIQILIQEGIDVNKKDNVGDNALLYNTKFNKGYPSSKVIKAFLAANVNIDAKTQDDRTENESTGYPTISLDQYYLPTAEDCKNILLSRNLQDSERKKLEGVDTKQTRESFLKTLESEIPTVNCNDIKTSIDESLDKRNSLIKLLEGDNYIPEEYKTIVIATLKSNLESENFPNEPLMQLKSNLDSFKFNKVRNKILIALINNSTDINKNENILKLKNKFVLANAKRTQMPRIEMELEREFRQKKIAEYEKTTLGNGGITSVRDIAVKAPVGKHKEKIIITHEIFANRVTDTNREALPSYANPNLLIYNEGSTLKIYSEKQVIRVKGNSYEIKEYGGKYRKLHEPESFIARLVGTKEHPNHNSEDFKEYKSGEFKQDNSSLIKHIDFSPTTFTNRKFVTEDGKEYLIKDVNSFISKHYPNIDFTGFDNNQRVEILYNHQQNVAKKYNNIDSISEKNIDNTFPAFYTEITDEKAFSSLAQIAYENDYGKGYNLNRDKYIRVGFNPSKMASENYLNGNPKYKTFRDTLESKHKENTNISRNILLLHPEEAIDLKDFLNSRKKGNELPTWISKDVKSIQDNGKVTLNFEEYNLDENEKKQLENEPDNIYLRGKKDRYEALKSLDGKNITKDKHRIKAAQYLGSHTAASYNSKLVRDNKIDLTKDTFKKEIHVRDYKGELTKLKDINFYDNNSLGNASFSYQDLKNANVGEDPIITKFKFDRYIRAAAASLRPPIEIPGDKKINFANFYNAAIKDLKDVQTIKDKRSKIYDKISKMQISEKDKIKEFAKQTGNNAIKDICSRALEESDIKFSDFVQEIGIAKYYIDQINNKDLTEQEKIDDLMKGFIFDNTIDENIKRIKIELITRYNQLPHRQPITANKTLEIASRIGNKAIVKEYSSMKNTNSSTISDDFLAKTIYQKEEIPDQHQRNTVSFYATAPLDNIIQASTKFNNAAEEMVLITRLINEGLTSFDIMAKHNYQNKGVRDNILRGNAVEPLIEANFLKPLGSEINIDKEKYKAYSSLFDNLKRMNISQDEIVAQKNNNSKLPVSYLYLEKLLAEPNINISDIKTLGEIMGVAEISTDLVKGLEEGADLTRIKDAIKHGDSDQIKAACKEINDTSYKKYISKVVNHIKPSNSIFNSLNPYKPSKEDLLVNTHANDSIKSTIEFVDTIKNLETLFGGDIKKTTIDGIIIDNYLIKHKLDFNDDIKEKITEQLKNKAKEITQLKLSGSNITDSENAIRTYENTYGQDDFEKAKENIQLARDATKIIGDKYPKDFTSGSYENDLLTKINESITFDSTDIKNEFQNMYAGLKTLIDDTDLANVEHTDAYAIVQEILSINDGSDAFYEYFTDVGHAIIQYINDPSDTNKENIQLKFYDARKYVSLHALGDTKLELGDTKLEQGIKAMGASIPQIGIEPDHENLELMKKIQDGINMYSSRDDVDYNIKSFREARYALRDYISSQFSIPLQTTTTTPKQIEGIIKQTLTDIKNNKVTETLKILQGRVDNLNEQIEALDEKMKQSVKDVSSKVEQINESLKDLDASVKDKFQGLSDDMNNIKGEIDKNQVTLEKIKTLSSDLKKVQIKQGAQIQDLQLTSLQHGTDISNTLTTIIKHLETQGQMNSLFCQELQRLQNDNTTNLQQVMNVVNRGYRTIYEKIGQQEQNFNEKFEEFNKNLEEKIQENSNQIGLLNFSVKQNLDALKQRIHKVSSACGQINKSLKDLDDNVKDKFEGLSAKIDKNQESLRILNELSSQIRNVQDRQGQQIVHLNSSLSSQGQRIRELLGQFEQHIGPQTVENRNIYKELEELKQNNKYTLMDVLTFVSRQYEDVYRKITQQEDSLNESIQGLDQKIGNSNQPLKDEIGQLRADILRVGNEFATRLYNVETAQHNLSEKVGDVKDFQEALDARITEILYKTPPEEREAAFNELNKRAGFASLTQGGKLLFIADQNMRHNEDNILIFLQHARITLTREDINRILESNHPMRDIFNKLPNNTLLLENLSNAVQSAGGGSSNISRSDLRAIRSDRSPPLNIVDPRSVSAGNISAAFGSSLMNSNRPTSDRSILHFFYWNKAQEQKEASLESKLRGLIEIVAKLNASKATNPDLTITTDLSISKLTETYKNNNNNVEPTTLYDLIDDIENNIDKYKKTSFTDVEKECENIEGKIKDKIESDYRGNVVGIGEINKGQYSLEETQDMTLEETLTKRAESEKELFEAKLMGDNLFTVGNITENQEVKRDVWYEIVATNKLTDAQDMVSNADLVEMQKILIDSPDVQQLSDWWSGNITPLEVLEKFDQHDFSESNNKNIKHLIAKVKSFYEIKNEVKEVTTLDITPDEEKILRNDVKETNPNHTKVVPGFIAGSNIGTFKLYQYISMLGSNYLNDYCDNTIVISDKNKIDTFIKDCVKNAPPKGADNPEDYTDKIKEKLPDEITKEGSNYSQELKDKIETNNTSNLSHK